MANCDCNSQLLYTWPDLLERNSTYVATSTKYKYNSYPHRTSHVEQLNSYYSVDNVTWLDALNRNKDTEAYTNSTAILNMVKAGIHLATKTVYEYKNSTYTDSYWIGLGNYTCSSGKYTQYSSVINDTSVKTFNQSLTLFTAEGMELSPLLKHSYIKAGTCFSYSAGFYQGVNCSSAKQTLYIACESGEKIT